MNLTTEQIEQIVKGAPIKDWTHYCTRNRQYFKRDGNTDMLFVHTKEGSVPLSNRPYWLERRERLEEILELRQEVERLKAQQSEVAARAVADACNQSCSVIASIQQEGVVNSRDGNYCDTWLSSSDLMRYANQLREQGNV